MTTFTVHTAETAPKAAASFQTAQKAFGFVPNLLAVMAEAPAAAQSFLALASAFDSTSLSAHEREVVLLTTSYENGCTYCMAVHSTLATMKKMPSDVLDALRSGQPIADRRLAALHAFTRSVVTSRGDVSSAQVDAFLAAGFTRAHVLEVLVGVTLKTLTNYTDHIVKAPLDAAFSPHAWSTGGVAAAAS